MKTEQALGNPLLPQLSELLARRMGLHFPEERWADLIRGITAAAREFQFQDADTCMQWLLSSPLTRRQIETLASHLTIGESYFFRDKETFDALHERILPELIQARRQSGKHLRIWSAGCSTGEEAYSIAILVQQLIPDYKAWNITILGTDINPHALRKASSGIYSDWSFRDTPPWLRDDYFRKIGEGRYEISPKIQEMVTFAYLNLAEDIYPSLANNTNAMDIIFCRNVLMYLEPRVTAAIVLKHYQVLVDDGWLIVGTSEVSQEVFAHFETVNLPGAILHQKRKATSEKDALNIALKLPASSQNLPSRPDTIVAEKIQSPSKAKSHISAGSVASYEQLLPVHAAAYQHALSLYLQGHYTEAMQAAVKLLAMHQDDVHAMHIIVRIHANQGELPAALQWCEKTITADRMNPVGHYLLAAILQELGQTHEAAQSLKRTLYLDQDFVLAHFALGNLCRHKGQQLESGRHFANALMLLEACRQDDVLPESDGITAGRLMEIIRTSMNRQEITA